MEKIKGYVEHIVYRNEENGYTVFHLNNENGELTCVGKFHYIEEGELLELEGEYTMHKLYGSQLQVESSRVCEPEDLVALGLSGAPDAAERRAELLRKLELPEHMSAKALLAALNALYTPSELEELLGK